MNHLIRGVLCLAVFLCSSSLALAQNARWSEAKANQWYSDMPWLVGCNFNPRTAINQLEMWQADTFDPKSIDEELSLAEGLGFNSIRVFLHHLAYQQDPQGFLNRMDQFLQIAQAHHIGVVFVPLDAVWDPFPKAGKQRDPKPHVHNSGWVQSPGAEILKDEKRHEELKPYIVAVLTRFKDDKRVHAWDIYNEPDNPNKSAYGKVELPNKAEMSLILLKKAFGWAREVNPSQPLTAGVWIGNWADPEKLSPTEQFCLENSDVISFHNYAALDEMKQCVENLRRYNRPLLCTEYMARPRGSTFAAILPYLKQQRVAAYNWGFVEGKTQTNYPWDTWTKEYTAAPEVWFHEIYRNNLTPYDPKEVELIKKLTK